VGEDWEVEFEYVDRIPNAATGKLQCVVPLASERAASRLVPGPARLIACGTFTPDRCRV
jgi:hypothetical protein